MAAKDSRRKLTKHNASATESVESFLAALEHPFKQEILALRQLILSTDPSIAEDIKWNAPSFRTSEHFATLHLRARGSVQVILHLGAKKRANATAGIMITDPEMLLEWLAKDRATIKFRDLKEIEAKRAAFAQIIRQWIERIQLETQPDWNNVRSGSFVLFH